MLTLWGRTTSVNVQKVLLCLAELDLPFTRIDAGLSFGVVSTPAYRAMNPNSLVPTLDDDGFILWESNSIVRYLAATYGRDKLWIEDIKQRCSADRWMDWQLSKFGPALGPAFIGLIRRPGSTPPDKIEASRLASNKLMGFLDDHLAHNRNISGEAFATADCVLAPLVHRWYNLPIDRDKTPHLDRWYAALMQRPPASSVLPTPIS